MAEAPSTAAPETAAPETDGPAARDEPRWLDAEERSTWLSFVVATRLLWDELERDLQQDAKMPFGYYDILVMLSESPDRARRMSELAASTQSSRSRLSHAVARLEQLGWVRRESCPTDRRGQVAVLTDEGFAVLRGAAPQHVASVRHHLFDQLSHEQLGQLHDICATLSDYLLERGRERGDLQAGVMQEARDRSEEASDRAGSGARPA
jgi:DNA-binding MarR family transcriptional regulator